jgi:DtxR family transcriptional regulator, Mn-dependent transcriptional regulator
MSEGYDTMSKKAAEEELFVGTAEYEHIEMYLKAIWYIRETGEEPKFHSQAT